MHKFGLKKLLVLLIIFLFFGTASGYCEDIPEEIDLQKYVGQQNVKTNDTKEIKNVIKKLTKYVNEKNIEGLDSLISDTYINNDGFTKDLYIDIVKKSWDLYPNLKYQSSIKEIQIDGDTAQVRLTDCAKGKIGNKEIELEKTGTISTTSESILFLQKYGQEWKIQSEYAIKEKTILAYSDAQLLKINMTSPNQVKSNSSYCAKLSIVHPKQFVTFASISNEQITYPPQLSDEIFKTITDDGILERMLNSNSEGKNEYLVATIGVTKPKISGNKITIQISGMAIITTRVNVVNQKQGPIKLNK